jgi:hypothetical protein
MMSVWDTVGLKEEIALPLTVALGHLPTPKGPLPTRISGDKLDASLLHSPSSSRHRKNDESHCLRFFIGIKPPEELITVNFRLFVISYADRIQ